LAKALGLGRSGFPPCPGALLVLVILPVPVEKCSGGNGGGGGNVVAGRRQGLVKEQESSQLLLDSKGTLLSPHLN